MADDIIVREGHTESIVEWQPRHDQQDTQPVFRPDSGSIVTLPGGVLLVLDGEWSQTRVDTFFAGQGIAAEPRRAAGFRPERLRHGRSAMTNPHRHPSPSAGRLPGRPRAADR